METTRASRPPRLLRTRWKHGPVPLTLCGAHVSVTEFTAGTRAHAAAVALAGLRLRRTWPTTPGALGMWLWADLAGRRSGSVSVWRDDIALKEFVGRPDHIETVRAHRGRGALRATSWALEDFEPDEVWTRAHALLTGAAPWPLIGTTPALHTPVHLEEA
ncbi:hypothetical protein H9Y04_10990 [Streptomyces sp. TRM66268-LWL]|uniref:DUF3291 domain-containing protein n=1 Tax=Streptomyces polyasparticus TaxID=2767826 RepID=A0ABR7SEC9_9ACTN|nr:hypothetical protein [Streptomyces polyasparticus]MBC9713095.1 hypothetical protein [Streptomyces polyasparticus]